MNWQELPLGHVSRWRPGVIKNGFEIEPRTPKGPPRRRFFSDGVRRLSQGVLYEDLDFGPGFSVTPDPDSGKPRIIRRGIAQTRERAVKWLAERAVPDMEGDDDWDVAWEPTSRTLCFRNRLTHEERPAGRREDSRWFQPTEDQAGSEGPSENQSTEALAAALALGYRSTHTVSQVLAFGNLRLDEATLDHTTMAETKFVDYDLQYIQITPLEWAVEHDRTALVRLFLEAGADANRTLWQAEGPALIRAARIGNVGLAEILARGSDRVTRTRALSLAAARGDVDVARALLEGAARCDFEAGDLPSHTLLDWDCQVGFGHISRLERCDFPAPLPRAIRSGHAELVRLLLEHGADVNGVYHGVNGRDPDFANQDYEEYECSDDSAPDPAALPPMPRFHFYSGQVVQLAMELGHTETVDLLLDYGADIDRLGQVREVPGESDRLPIGYRLVPRSVYLRVMAGLREASDRRKGMK